MDYEDIQQNEVEALRAIYMEDFQEVERQKVWNKASAPQFSIRLSPTKEYKSAIELTIQVVMSSTYPKTLPEITVVNSNDLHPKQLDLLRELIKNTIKERKGEEMIFEVTSNLQDRLDEYARMDRDSSTSLDEDRVKRLNEEKMALDAAKEQKRRDEVAKQQKRKKDFDEMVFEELQQIDSTPQFDDSSLRIEEVSLIPETADVFTFDRPIVARQFNGSSVHFQQIIYGSCVSIPFIGSAYAASPVIAATRRDELELPLLIIHIPLENKFWETTEGRKQLHDLECELDIIKEFHHANVLPLYEYQIGRYKGRKEESQHHQIVLLSPMWSISCLADLIDAVGTVSIRVAKTWGIQLLEGLEALHKFGITHKCLNTRTISINKDPETGENMLLLCWPSFHYKLEQMNAVHPFSSRTKKAQTPLKWTAPELERCLPPTRKTDVWQFGAVLLQALCGPQIMDVWSCPTRFVRNERSNWPSDLAVFLTRILDESPKKRPSAFDMLMDSFTRTGGNFEGTLETFRAGGHSRRYSSEVQSVSSAPNQPQSLQGYSRYLNDFDEGVVLGRGGFGQVVKARNKLDGRVYAIKKLQATSKTLSQILQEVVLLSRLDHQYVVRYYTVWLEEQQQSQQHQEEENEPETETETEAETETTNTNTIAVLDGTSARRFAYSLSELDLFNNSQVSSSSGLIQFGDTDSGSDSDDETSQNPSDPVHPHSEDEGKLARIPLPVLKSTLYIQMQYCENHTLRDLIKNRLYQSPKEYWRLFREIVEALEYIHGEGIIHRDLKPTNIFIDQAQNVKIGDFGLARSVAQPTTIGGASDAVPQDAEDLTTDVGTSLYVAVELLSSEGKYNEKVDMYSLGIIYFEMVYPMTTEMERVHILRRLRQSPNAIPTPFMGKRYDRERKLVRELLNHNAVERPSAAQILKSGDIPSSSEELTVKDAIKSIVDSKDNSSIQDVCNALFSRPLVSAQQILYDRTLTRKRKDAVEKMSLQHAKLDMIHKAEVVHRLNALFRVHGAVEEKGVRSRIFPRSALYQSKSVFELLDNTGNVLQLPFDLTLPYARRLAESDAPFAKTFTFGSVFRQEAVSHHPRVAIEVDFDITSGSRSVDPHIEEAEAIKVMAEAVYCIPFVDHKSVAIYINHCNILNEILDYCGFTPPQHHGVLSLLGETGIGPARSSVRRELLAKSNISNNSLDLWEKMAFKECVEQSESRLLTLLESQSQKRILPLLQDLKSVIKIVRRFGVSCPIHLAPLSHYHPQFYENGIMFQMVFEYHQNKRTVVAAGGRYDSLVKYFSNDLLDTKNGLIKTAVGFNLALDKVLDYTRRFMLESPPKTGRCQFLVTSFSESSFKSVCIDVVRQLWINEISADIAPPFGSSEELLRYCRLENIPFAVIVKQNYHMSTAGSKYKPLKLRIIDSKLDFDFTVEELVNYAMTETVAERTKSYAVHQNESDVEPTQDDAASTQQQPLSQQVPERPERKVVLFRESSKSEGRKNRWLLEEKCEESINQYLGDLASSPIVCLDLKDDILQSICQISPHNEDEWRRRITGLNPGQKAYIMSVQQKLAAEASRATRIILYSIKSSNVFVYNVEQF